MFGQIEHSNEYRIFENKSITKKIRNNWIEHKICELKCENAKISNVWKYT